MAWYRAGGGGIPSSLKTGMNSVLNKKFGTSTTYDPAGWPDDVNLMGPLPEKTASGAIAHFDDGADDVPLAALSFFAEPIQASGTPSPSNPLPISGHTEMNGFHTGKNLLPNKTYQRNANTLRIGTDTLDGRLSLKAGTYMLSLTSDVVIGSLVYTIGGTSTGITFTSSGTRYYGSFALSADTDDLFIHVYKSGGYTAENISDFMLEVGNTVSDYVAYSAPETHKWTFPPFGTNQWNEKWEAGIWNSSGQKSASSSPTIRCADYIKVTPETTYYVAYNTTVYSSGLVFRLLDSEKAFVRTVTISSNSRTFTTDSNVYYVVFCTYGVDEISTYKNDIAINYPSSATSYEPYQSMFSGQVNALTGEMESDAKTVDLGTLTWNVDANRTGVFYTNAISDAVTDNCAMLCSAYKVDNAKNPNTILDYELCSRSSYGGKRVFIKNTDYSGYTGAQVASALSGTILLYELSTPISIDMDSVDWQTELGDNNFYNDCGDTSVEYRADIDLALGGN